MAYLFSLVTTTGSFLRKRAFIKPSKCLKPQDLSSLSWAADFAGFQVQGIKSIPEVPVHPGLAHYLKEKGLWDPAWKIATEGTIKAAIEAMKAKAK